MATEVGSAYVSIIPSAKGFGRTLNSGIGRQVDQSGTRAGKQFGQRFGGGVGSSLVGVGKRIAAIAGPLAVLGGVRVLGNFVADARESAKISALTAQAIKSTGGAANVSAKQVAKLATRISQKTGVDDEAVQSGANLLLTFTNIRNELGKGNKIFDRANQTVTDMSAALGQDTKSSAIQLGKALNDPVKGITALSRVGVSFTEQQRAQIKAMVESGDVVGAQKVILAELSKEFGGAAAAMATPGDRLKVALGNVGEAIGAQLIPQIDKFAQFMVAKGIPAMTRFGGYLKANALPVLKQFGTFVKTTVIPALVRFGGFLQANVLPVLRQLGAFITGTVVPGLIRMGGFIQRNQAFFVPFAAGILAIVAAIKIWRAVTVAFTAVQAILNAVLVANPIGLIILAVVGLVTALVVAYKRSETFRNVVNGAFRAIQVVAGNAISIIIKAFKFLLNVWLTVAGGILNGAAKAFGWIPGIGGKLKGAAAAFGAFKDSTNATLDSLANGAAGWGDKTAKNYTEGMTAALQKRGATRSVAVGTANRVNVAARADVRRGAAGGGVAITINNPRPERASESVPKALRRKLHAVGY